MRVGLIDADGGKFPNLALMKLSAHHKAIGDHVEWVNYWQDYDKVYISKVFSYTPEPDTVIRCDNIVAGGTGYSLDNTLPDEIERCFPDYSIYPCVSYAIGFLTRGCSRNCPFCIVNKKEGSCHRVASLSDFWSGQREIKLLDPNLLECRDNLLLLHDLAETQPIVTGKQIGRAHV